VISKRELFRNIAPDLISIVLPLIRQSHKSSASMHALDPHSDNWMYGCCFHRLLYNKIQEASKNENCAISKTKKHLYECNDLNFRIYRVDKNTKVPSGGLAVKKAATRNLDHVKSISKQGLLPGFGLNYENIFDTTTILGIVCDINEGPQEVFFGDVVLDNFEQRNFSIINRHIAFTINEDGIFNSNHTFLEEESDSEPVVLYYPAEGAIENDFIKLDKSIRLKKIIKKE